MRMTLLKLMMLLAIGLPALAQDIENREKILLPIIPGQISGAHGSLWSTGATVANQGGQPVEVRFPQSSGCMALCPPEESILNPDESVVFFQAAHGRENVGIFVYVERGKRAQLGVTLRSQDLSRQHETWGTSIPVVTEDDLHDQVFGLVELPLEAQFRTMLRIYDFDANTPGTVRLRIFALESEGETDSDQLIFESTVVLNPPLTDSQKYFHPGVAQIPLDELLQGHSGRVRVEIEPVDDRREYWAFASVTHNSTQHVTVVTPQ